MIVVLAIDALEYGLVERFNCVHLKQRFYGKTDISEFSEPRTMVLWTSFMTGRNMESWVLSKGDKEMWNISLDIGETFFNVFKDPVIIDLPGYNYDKEQHAKEREMLKQYFETDNIDEKARIRENYNICAFNHHKKVKAEFFKALDCSYDFVLGYFSLADVIGHLNFGNNTLMRMIYRDFDEIASQVSEVKIILSDHGMTPIGMFGDHSGYGFWSSGRDCLDTPKITEMGSILCDLKKSVEN